MDETKLTHNAKLVGRQPIQGPLNDTHLSDVVSTLQAGRKASGLQEDTRCNVEFQQGNLLLTYIKKDEGFESDTESANSVETKEEKTSAGGDEKIIKDHVFRFGDSTGEDSYSCNSGGSDSETSDHNKSTSAPSSASASPTAQLSRYKFDHLETYSIGDVLICHTDKLFKNCVIWVIRKSGSLEALVFECLTEENARQLYRRFHEVSKRSKLERHRRRKSDGGSIVTRATHSELPQHNQTVSINNTEIEKGQWNLVQHTDKNGVTHIEVESANLPASLVTTRSNEEPRSLGVSFQPSSGRLGTRGAITRTKPLTEKSKFAKELENILSSEIKRRDEASDTSRGQGGTVLEGDGSSQVYTRQRPPGESLSLRQRAPAMLLRKLDEFEEKAHRIWAKAEAEEENRKVWNKGSNSVIGISSPPPRGPTLETEQKNNKEMEHRSKQGPERKEERASLHASKCKQKGGGDTDAGLKVKEEGGGRMLVPTKTGKEPPRKLYPKESPPIYAGRFLPVGVPSLPHSQPHSLPIYPVQWAPGRPMGFMEAGPQVDLSQSVWRLPKGTYGGPPREERSRSRERGRLGPPDGRRGQSKSPARRPRMEAVPTPDISGLGRMFRELGAGVRARMTRAKTPLHNSSSESNELPSPTKSNLKKKEEDTAKESDNKKVHFNKFATVQMMA